MTASEGYFWQNIVIRASNDNRILIFVKNHCQSASVTPSVTTKSDCRNRMHLNIQMTDFT